jgi:putative colanic acid biosynthesis acetyltransferase WcaF
MMANSYQDLSRFRMPPGFRGRGLVVVQLWRIVQATLFAWSPWAFDGWRCLLLRAFGARVGQNVVIRPSARVTYPWQLSIGDNAWIGEETVLYSFADIAIGANAVISQRSYLCAGGHDYSDPSFAIFGAPIVIGPEAWIATDVFVAPGVTIGHGAVVGARSSVFADLPGGMICLGSPAKPVKPRVMQSR